MVRDRVRFRSWGCYWAFTRCRVLGWVRRVVVVAKQTQREEWGWHDNNNNRGESWLRPRHRAHLFIYSINTRGSITLVGWTTHLPQLHWPPLCSSDGPQGLWLGSILYLESFRDVRVASPSLSSGLDSRVTCSVRSPWPPNLKLHPAPSLTAILLPFPHFTFCPVHWVPRSILCLLVCYCLVSLAGMKAPWGHWMALFTALAPLLRSDAEICPKHESNDMLSFPPNDKH